MRRNHGRHRFDRAFGRFVISPAFLVVSLLVFCLVPEKLVRRTERQALAKSLRRTLGMVWVASSLSRWMPRGEGKRTVMDRASGLPSPVLGGIDHGDHQGGMDPVRAGEN